MANSSDRIAKQYVLEKEIAKTKSSQVFLAHDEKVHRRVAVKIIARAAITNKNRLFQVTGAVAELDHPNILRIYAVGETDNQDVYVVSELLDGFPLNTIVPKDVGLTLGESWPIISQVAAGLDAAHSAGLLHLDIKPSNIFVAHDEEDNEIFKIIDFGISQFISDQNEAIVGTPGYIAPELITHSAAPSVQSDIYGLGALLYFLLLGRRPFDAASTQEVLEKQIKGLLMNVEPEHLQDVILTSMNPDPQKRHISVEAFSNALSEVHRESIMIPESENNSSEEPTENVTEFALGRFMIATVVLTLVGVTMLLYFWLVSGT